MILADYDAEYVRISTMKDSNDKLRVTFKSKNKEKAIKCYKDFHQSNSAFEGTRTVIFLIKSGNDIS
jgi:hypothetical protein